MGPQRDPTFVLIHSPLVGPTTWSPVARELERRGRDVVVPPLLAHVGTPQWHHAVEAVGTATASVVLVGHSGAGLLLPAIAAALTPEVAALVFVDSFLPPPSGNVRLVPPEFMGELQALAENGVLPPWSSWFGERAMAELIPDDRLRAALVEEMPRLPLSYLAASLPVPAGWDTRPCAYILFDGEAYGEAAAEARARGWPVTELPGVQHLAIATEPGLITDALLKLVD